METANLRKRRTLFFYVNYEILTELIIIIIIIIMNNAEIRVTLSLTLKVFQRHFTKLYSWKGIPGTRRSSRKRTITNGGSACRWYDKCRRGSRPETTTSLYISRQLKCLNKVRWRDTIEATMRQNTQTKLYYLRNFQPV